MKNRRELGILLIELNTDISNFILKSPEFDGDKELAAKIGEKLIDAIYMNAELAVKSSNAHPMPW